MQQSRNVPKFVKLMLQLQIQPIFERKKEKFINNDFYHVGLLDATVSLITFRRAISPYLNLF